MLIVNHRCTCFVPILDIGKSCYGKSTVEIFQFIEVARAHLFLLSRPDWWGCFYILLARLLFVHVMSNSATTPCVTCGSSLYSRTSNLFLNNGQRKKGNLSSLSTSIILKVAPPEKNKINTLALP